MTRPPTFRQLARRLSADAPRLQPKDDRPSARKRGYDSKWEAFARLYLRQHKWCRECAQHGDRLIYARAVDHIVPWREWKRRGGSKYDAGNLQPLCEQCHARKSARERTGGEHAD